MNVKFIQELSNYISLGNPAADSEVDGEEKEDEGENSESDEWFIPQNVTEKEPLISLDSPQYGFGNKISRALDAFEVDSQERIKFFFIVIYFGIYLK